MTKILAALDLVIASHDTPLAYFHNRTPGGRGLTLDLVGEGCRVGYGTHIYPQVTLREGTIVGADCVVGHNAHLEGCIVEDGALVGSGSTVLHQAVVRTGSLVGANALVPGGMEVPTGAMALGVPAKLREMASVSWISPPAPLVERVSSSMTLGIKI